MMNKGFTILETIVAISLVSIAISGVFAAVTTNLQASSLSKDQVQAFYLAQEALEVLRQKRDSNKLISLNTDPTQTWLEGIADSGNPCTPGNTCRVDANDMSLTNCGGSGCGPLLQDTTGGGPTYRYGYTAGWTPTKYTREIQISSNGADEIEVTISVQWKRGVIDHDFTVRTLLFDWR